MFLQFTKMHGAGNDFIFINAMEVPFDLTEDQIRFLCDRNFGIGCDQLIVVCPSQDADFRMDIYNSDGGKVEMCGNGIRCFAKYVLDQKLTTKTALSVETMAGIICPEILKNHSGSSKNTLWVKVDMGKPLLDGPEIPVNSPGLVINYAFQKHQITCVSMGNPHCVIFVNDVLNYPVTLEGPQLEDDPFFPNRINVEFIEVINRRELKMRVWERGAGETMACGTGACAAGVAAILNNKTDRQMTIHLNGGDLEIEWDENSNHVFMTGPATTVFEGEIEL